jgi:photosystem II stability/assembly factor-like uncharacterized protein
MHTENGGESWMQQTLPTGIDAHSVKFLDDSVGFALGSGHVWRTTNGGTDWTIQFSYDTQDNTIESYQFIDRERGWMVTWFVDHAGHAWDSYDIVRTVDGGITWHWCMDQFGIYGLQFVDSLKGWAWTQFYELYRTQDGGINWQFLPSVGHINRFLAIDSSRVFIHVTPPDPEPDGYYGWLRSDDGGESWTQLPDFPNTLAWKGADDGWALDGLGRILRTGDGGQTWIAGDRMPTRSLSSYSIKGDHLWGLSDEYGLLHCYFPDPFPPDVPQSVTIAVMDTSRVRLNWTPVLDDHPIHYEIRSDLQESGLFETLVGITGDTTFVDSTSLSASSVKRFYCVKAVR